MTPEQSKVNLQLTRTYLICLLDKKSLFFITFQLLNSLLRNALLTSNSVNKTWPSFGCGRSFSDVTFSLFAFPLSLSALQFAFKFAGRDHQARAIYKSFNWSTMGKILSCENFYNHWRQTSYTTWKKPCLILSKRLITAIKQLIFDCKLKVLLV